MPHPLKVLSQRQVEKVLDDGEVHSVVSIAVNVGRFGPFVLDVPADQYNQENVVPMARDLEFRAGTVAYAIENLFRDEQGPQAPGRPEPAPSPPRPGPPTT